VIRRVIALVALVACHDKPDDAPARVPAAEPGAEHGAHGPEVVQIAPDMMRDLRVTIGKARARPAGETVAALGELRVNEDAYAEVASPVAARVTRVLVKAGDAVKAGQPLVELASPELGQGRAELAAAGARVELARQQADRKRALAADRLVPERERVDADAAVKEAEAAYRVAAAALGKFGPAAGDGIAIRAPLAGTVIERSVVLGQLADPARTLFRIGDLSTLWLHAHVFERDAVRVRTGRVATATFAALPGQATDATIQWIGREVDAASRTIDIRLEVANPGGVLRPGMSATVALPLGDAGAAAVITVPAAAVQRVGAAWAVFAPRGPGAFAVRAIGRGRDLAGEVEVLSGLAAGDEVIVEGAFLLKAEADKVAGGGHED
jgi:cobalt-zinc-cadmium efflux system membrane fusion protein